MLHLLLLTLATWCLLEQLVDFIPLRLPLAVRLRSLTAMDASLCCHGSLPVIMTPLVQGQVHFLDKVSTELRGR